MDGLTPDAGGQPVAGPVEAYLDRLFDLLAGTGAAGRRALDEVADHLHESSAAGVASGLSEVEAERAAVDRFGPVDRVAGELRPAPPPGVLVRRLAASAALLGSIGLVAIGLSGLVAGVLGAMFGQSFVSGDPAGVRYSSARCVDLLEYFPHATSCQAAAVAHHFDEVVTYRTAAGVLGLLGLAGFWLLRRYGPLRSSAWRPRGDLVVVVGTGAFGTALVVFGGAGSMQALSGRPGAGQLVSAGLASAIALAWFVPLLLRELRLLDWVRLLRRPGSQR